MTRFRAALVWSFGERYASIAIGLASTMVIARLLTPEEIGIYSLCAAAVAIATMVREFGVSEYIVQEKELDDQKLRNAFAVAFTTAWSIGLLLFATRQQLADAYHEPRVAALLGILSINFLLLPLSSPAFALLNREMALRKVFILQISASLVQTVVGLVLALQGFGAASLAWSAVAGTVVQTVVVSIMRPRSSFMLPSFHGAGRVFRYGAYQMSARLAETLTGNAHEFIIARQLGFAQVGLFSRAKGLIDMFHMNVLTAVLRVSTPMMAEAHRAGAPLAGVMARGTAILSGVCWPVYGFLAVAAPEVIRVMLGPQWDAAAPVATLLAAAMAPTALYALGPGVLIAMGQVERRLKVTLAYCVVHVLALACAWPFGLRAIALVWLASSLASLGLYAWQLRRLLKLSLRGMYSASVASVLVTAGCTAVEFALMQWARAQQLNAVLSVMLVGTAGLLAWLALARMTHHPAFIEASRIANRLAPWRRAPT